MSYVKSEPHVEIFSTAPQSADGTSEDYVRSVIEVAQWSEAYGCKGILIYSDNRLVDPWLVAQVIVQHTTRLCPLVAVQPIYMHPYSVATMTSSLAFMYGRRIYLNMIAGGFKNDLTAFNDATPHDKRYDRLKEYTLVIKNLLAGHPVTYEGEFYSITNLKLTPPLPTELFPGIFMSGSSEAGLQACHDVGATAIKYPKSSSEEDRQGNGTIDSGVRIGIISRSDEEEAWRVAHERFPVDRKGQLTHQLTMKVSDSVWHKQLSALAAEAQTTHHPYWLVPFENYKTFCPYLVGSYHAVGEELARYIKVGYEAFILDIPTKEDELRHSAIAFEHALKQVAL